MCRLLTSFCACAALLVTPLAAAKPTSISWGKLGVSLDQYRDDAVACGRAGYYRDVAGTEAAQVFKRATSQLESNESDMQSLARTAGSLPPMDIVGVSTRIVASTRPGERMNDVRDLLQDTVAVCLRQRGYTPFWLTKTQQSRLRHLHLGSPERHAYLHGLATDPNVLRAQAI